MRNNNTVVLIGVLILVALALYVILPLPHPDWLARSEVLGGGQNLMGLKLGLDLQGGTQVMLESDLPADQVIPPGAIDTAKSVVEARVNGLGVAEAIVQKQGENRVIAELPGVKNPEQAIDTIRSTGQLEFVDPGGAQLDQGMVINTTNRPDAVTRAQETADQENSAPPPTPFDQVFQTAMTGDVLSQAIAKQDQYNQWEIGFALTPDGSDKFYSYTSQNVGRPMAIVLDGVVLSAPVINSAIRDQGVITGRFTQDEAESLAVQMQYGALPIPLKVVDVRTIGATLGQDSVRSSVIAGIIGLVAVFIFMLVMYRVPGVIADIALVFYIIFNLAIFKLIPITLTLPGIAAFLLSIGMAVDANILIFERMKEELRAGRSPRTGRRRGLQPRLVGHLRWSPDHTDQLCRALLVWQHLWRQRRERVRHHLGYRCVDVAVHGCVRDTCAHARYSGAAAPVVRGVTRGSWFLISLSPDLFVAPSLPSERPEAQETARLTVSQIEE